ncbi:hypothetical protein Y032_0014g2270 [Ancylostoma ceylanicum]|uniref:IBR domain-containing protein n=1 Tax=Ancylostoma ceylanicum TaxID=53326 RepID=A0A016VBC3_9BILA|nr:hypothetical protein Y032_0014g2270 [Ancylostoma ceylanicum]
MESEPEEEYCKGAYGKDSRWRKCNAAHRGDTYLQRKMADRVVISKTLHDPANILSKRAEKRLIAQLNDGICPYVLYSLNKKQRWRTITPASLLRLQHPVELDAMVVNRRIGPAKGKRRRTQRKGACCEETSHAIQQFLEPEFEEDSDFGYAGVPYSRSLLTLGDFMQQPSPSRTVPVHKSTAEVGSEKVTSKLFPDLIDISRETNAPHVFEVIDVPLKRLKPFDFREEISKIAQDDRIDILWLDEDRIRIDASFRVRIPANEPLHSPLLIIFFERMNSAMLRIRINANALYALTWDDYELNLALEEQEDVSSLYHTIVSFIWKLRNIEWERWREQPRTRYNTCKENFSRRVNGRRLAVQAESYCVYDQMRILNKRHRATQSFHIDADHNLQQKDNFKGCSSCESNQKSDLFPWKNGLICRDCVAHSVVRQIRLNQFPVDVPLDTKPNFSVVDLLFAILPLPVACLYVTMSCDYYRTLDGNETHSAVCPRCSLTVAFNDPSKLRGCICPSCECHWCYFCSSEPHWPMSCQQFEEWSQKWDRQYMTDKHFLDPDECMLRILCGECGLKFDVAESIAHGTLCPTQWCHSHYDDSVLMCKRRDTVGHAAYALFPLDPQYRKAYRTEGLRIPKMGREARIEKFWMAKLIKKDFADVCVEARKLRFNQERTAAFEQEVSRKGHSRITDLRLTAFTLVENCSAWLYLNRHDTSNNYLMKSVRQLFQHALTLEAELENRLPNVELWADTVNKSSSDLISSFQKMLSNTNL